MNKALITFVAAAGLTVFGAAPAMANTVTVAKNIPYKKGAKIAKAIKGECDLGRQLSSNIVKFGKKYDVKVEQKGKISTRGKGKVLVVNITDAVSQRVGMAHNKSVSIAGALYQNGKRKATFKGRRMSGGGAFGMYSSSCKVLNRSTKALGKDIAIWLGDPQNNARLGDLSMD